MPLNYDFDIRSVVPEDSFSDPQSAKLLALSGITFDGLSNKLPLFRDPTTAAALRKAPEHIRRSFIDAGFGFDAFKSGAPRGFYPATDKESRSLFLTKLSQNLGRGAIADVDEGQFSVSDFLEAQRNAKPLTSGQFQPVPEPQPHDLPDGETIYHPSNSIVGAVMSASFGLLCGLALIAYTAMELLK